MGKSDPAAKQSGPAPAHLDARAADPIEFRGFIADLFAAAASMQSLRKAIARSRGLGGTELAILLSVWHLGQRAPVGIKALAAHLHVAGPNITIEVATLVKKGLLTKVVDERDTRAIVLKLTRAGSSTLTQLSPLLATINDDLFKGLNTAEIRRLRSFFVRLIEAAGRSKDQITAEHEKTVERR
jgi:DNA-binding MarR family transcriptional regulator